RTALLGILSTIVVSMILKETRINFAKFITALTSGARTALGVAAATATAGIIVGVVTKTGLGLKMGNSSRSCRKSFDEYSNAVVIHIVLYNDYIYYYWYGLSNNC